MHGDNAIGQLVDQIKSDDHEDRRTRPRKGLSTPVTLTGQWTLRHHLAVRHRDVRSIAVISSNNSANTRRAKVDLSRSRSRARDERSVSLANVAVSDASTETDECLIDLCLLSVRPSVVPGGSFTRRHTHELYFVIDDDHWSMFFTIRSSSFPLSPRRSLETSE
jgi:hypothetical protein